MDPPLVSHNQGPAEDMLHHAPQNRLLPLALARPVDHAFVSSRDFGLEAMRATRYHREFLAPCGDHDAIAFVVTREGHGHAAAPPAARGDPQSDRGCRPPLRTHAGAGAGGGAAGARLGAAGNLGGPGVSLATIRSHLAELFRRTGTRNQAELVARILGAASAFSAP
jgi:hypothetical protein